MKEITTPENRKDRGRPPWWAFALLLGAATLILVFFGWSARSWELLLFEILLGMAALSVGGLLGFLFGIPKSLTREAAEGSPLAEATSSASESSSPPQAGTGLSYRPSNNLEQVSDWLTKIIIGVGLVEFKEIGEALSNTGNLVRREIASGGQAVLGIGVLTQVVIVVFAVLGFLISFLWTRLYYGAIQTLADADILSEVKANLSNFDRRLSQQAEETKNVGKVTNLLASGSLVQQEAATTAPRSASLTRELPSPEQEWPQKLRDQVESLKRARVEWYSDTVRELFPGFSPEANGRKLTAEIVAHLEGALVLSVRVQRVGGDPLQGEVSFLLHPTFPNRVVTAPAKDDRAEINISASEWFTVGAIADQGHTVLTYDLRSLPNAPGWFTKQ